MTQRKLKVGIPRGLFYYRDFPFWKTFFEELGAEILVSPKTNAKILEEGVAKLTGDICLPVKAFCGHCLALAEDCDFLFIPSIYSLEKKVYNCPKLIGLPDLIKIAVGDKIKILEPDINFEKGKENFLQNLYRLAKNFTDNFQKIKSAIKEAEKKQEDFKRLLKQKRVFLPKALEQSFTLAKKENYQLKVGLVGRPYLVYDEYLNHQLIEKLKKLKTEILFPEQIPAEKLRSSLLKLVDKSYWTYEEEIIGAGVYFLDKKDISGLIYLSSFGCGPDSMMCELLKRYAKTRNKILLHLNLDEQTASAGLITRIEAFVDSLYYQKQNPVFSFSEPKTEKEKIEILGVPNIGERFSVLEENFKKFFGINLISPPVTKKTILLGTKYSPEDACLPFKALLGGFIECLEEGADALLMVTSFNACRMGYYVKVQEKILKGLGYKFRFLKFHSKDRGARGIFSLMKKLTNDAPWPKIISFLFLAVLKLKILDEIERKVQKIRPKEIKKGSGDKIYREAISALNKVENIFSLLKTRREFLKRLKEIPKNESFKPLKVGIVGEFYVVAESFINMDIERELGERGVETERIKSAFLSEYLNPPHFNPLGREKKRLKKFTNFYLKRDIGGHGLESLGLKIDYSQKGYDGLVHLMPFTCLPETIARNIMLSTKEKIPVLTVICDEEQGKAGLITRVEAFVDLLFEKRKKI